MSSRRAQKVAEAIREVVSMAILAELNDPRIRGVTVTYVEISADLRHAKIHVSIMGDEARQRLSLRGLESAAGFLQSKVARRIETRYTPHLIFLLDQGVKRSIEVAKILREVLPPEESVEAPDDVDHQIPSQADDRPAPESASPAAEPEPIPPGAAPASPVLGSP